MKKLLSIMAPIAIICLFEGVLFKMLHLPGGSYLILAGGIVGIVAAIVGMIFSLQKHEHVASKWIVGLSVIVTIVAIVFKLLHLPGFGILCLAGFGVLMPLASILLAIRFANKQ